MGYIDAQENLKTRSVKSGQIRAVQRNRKRHWSQLVAMPDSSSNSGSVGCEDIPCQEHRGDGAVTMIAEGSVSNAAAEVIKVPKMFDQRQKVLSMDWRICLVIPQRVLAVVGVRASWSVLQTPARGRVVRQRRHASGDRRADAECMRRELRRGFFLSTVSLEVSLGAKLAQAQGSAELHVDWTLLHSCTFLSLVIQLLCALDHPSDAFALAQGVSQK